MRWTCASIVSSSCLSGLMGIPAYEGDDNMLVEGSTANAINFNSWYGYENVIGGGIWCKTRVIGGPTVVIGGPPIVIGAPLTVIGVRTKCLKLGQDNNADVCPKTKYAAVQRRPPSWRWTATYISAS